MEKLKQYSALVEKIYAAAAQPADYGALAAEIAAFLGVGSAVIQARDNAGSAHLVSTTDNFTSQSLLDYGAHYYSVDEWVLRGGKTKAGTVFQGSELIPFREFEETECYVDYGRRLGLYDCVAAVFPTAGGICAFGVHRAKPERPFDDFAKLHVELLLPHLRNSLELAGKLEQAGRRNLALAGGLDRLSVAVVIVDSDRRVHFSNPRADEILAASDGVHARARRLHACDPKADQKLAHHVRQAAALGDTQTGRLLLPRRDGAAPLCVRILPAPRGTFPFLGDRHFVSLFLGEESETQDVGALLRDMFRLTPAEARLVQALMTGVSLRAYADDTRISVETARTQVKSVFSKTGTSRQSELIALLNRNPVLGMK